MLDGNIRTAVRVPLVYIARDSTAVVWTRFGRAGVPEYYYKAC
jgi:hypothetical protein